MDFRPQTDIFRILQKHGVPFVIVGGHAVNYHGYIRATEDVDVVWVRSPASEASLLSALQEVNARWLGREIDPNTGLEREHPISASYVQITHLMMLLTDAGFLDLFDYVPGVPELTAEELYGQSGVFGEWRVVSLGVLLKMKDAAGREKDRSDIERLSRS